MNKDLVFIVSPGRTGTKFLGTQLSDMIPGAFSVHEPDLNHGPFDRRTWENLRVFGPRHMIVDRLRGRTGARILARAYLSGKMAHEDLVRNIRASREAYFSGRPEPLLIEANFQWSLVLPALRTAFPAAHVVLITRGRHGWVQSWMRRGRYTGRDPVRKGRISPELLGDPVLGPRWPDMTPREKLEWEWEFVHGKLETFAQADPLTKLFRYEDLFVSSDRISHFRRLLDHVAHHEGRDYEIQFEPEQLQNRINAS